jgi:hypothetical protein
MKPKLYFLLLAVILMSSKNSFCQWDFFGNAVPGNAFLGTTNGQDLNLITENPRNINFYTNAGAGTFLNLRMIIKKI